MFRHDATVGALRIAGDGCHRKALADLAATARLWRLCGALAWHDLRLRYHGSVLGPFWVTLSTALAVAALGGVYANLFRQPAAVYVPYLAVSLVGWNAIASLLTDASRVFVDQAAIIRGQPMPFGVHAARLLLRSVFATLHAALVLPPVLMIYGIAPGWPCLALLPALLLWLMAGFGVALGLGAACVRFRDIPPALAGALQLGLLVTPVLWPAELLGGNIAWLLANPLHDMLEILRAPVLGQVPTASVWAAAAFAAVVCAGTGWWMFAATRSRLAIWL